MSELLAHESNGKVEVLALNLAQTLDVKEFDRLADSVTRIIAAKPAGRWIIDLSQVQYTGSTLLGLLVNLRQQIKESGGALVLCAPSPRLVDILRACSLDRLFRTAATRDAAQKAVG